MKRLIIEHPWWIILPRKTKKDVKISFSLNIILNLHFTQYSAAKKQVKENIERYLKETKQDKIKFKNKVKVTFTVYKPTKRRTDKSNFYSGASKLIYDALVELGTLVDDNDDFIGTEFLNETVHCKDNPRLEFIVEEM